MSDNVEYSVVHDNMNQLLNRGTDCSFCCYDWLLNVFSSLMSCRGSPLLPPQLELYLNSSSQGVIHTLLGSDILYASDCYPQLEKTLQALRFEELIITYKRRHDECVKKYPFSSKCIHRREKEFLGQLEQFYHIQVTQQPFDLFLTHLESVDAAHRLYLFC
jgi:hypothetical protein